MKNDPDLTDLVRASAGEILTSAKKIIEIKKPHLGSEDFSYYQKEIPGTIFMLGVGVKGEDRGTLHSNDLNIHESNYPGE